MKSIFTRPLFINPQAYLTIPELSYIQMATPFDFTEDSYSFIINTSGRIEGKLLKTSNDYILHLDLYSIDGNCVLGEFYLNNSELNTDNFNLTQSKNIITLQFGEQSSGNITYPGLIAAWSAKGKSNDDKDRATLKDLTGNGHDITLNGFSFSEMSGYGGYKTNMLNWKYNKNSAVILSSANKFIMYNTTEIATHFWDYVSKPPLGTIHRPSFKLKISGLNEDEVIYYRYTDGEDFSVAHERIPLYNGINIFPEINAEIVTEKLPYTTLFEIHSQRILDKEITFEILPEYPDALVFDGVNDYGFCKNIPLLEDYTIIAKRKDCSGGCLFNKGADTRGAFILEGFGFISNTYNFGRGQNKNLLNNDIITWQNKNSYNQQSLIIGNDLDRTNQIIIGKLSGTDPRILKGAFYSAYLFDRSLDEQEIKAFIRKYIDPEYLLPSEIPTPDCYYDFSQGSNDDETRETIKDYSGNGNDAVAHNFAWSGMSGYGGYAFDAGNLYIPTQHRDAISIVGNKIILNSKPQNSIATADVFAMAVATVGETGQSININIPAFKVKISGLLDGGYLMYNYSTSTNSQTSNNWLNLIRLGNGITEIPAINTKLTPDSESDYCYINPCRLMFGTLANEESFSDITIEILPEYEGALVFDGTDDYVSLDAFDSGFKTMFMICNPFKNVPATVIYDQRYPFNRNYAILTANNKIAYEIYNQNKTFINNKENTKLICNELLNKKHLIHVLTEEIYEGIKLRIGSSVGDNQYTNMALYKFLGFKEALTEEQIQAVIKKYNLLDGVDEIEVS